MEKILHLLSSWLMRYVLIGITSAGAIWNSSPEENNAAAAWVGGAITFFVAAALRWVKLKYLGLTGKTDAAKTLVAILFLSAGLYQIQRSQSQAYTLRQAQGCVIC